jgi:hypothetical protein
MTEQQVVERTGRTLAYWKGVLDKFGASGKEPRNVVGHLCKSHHVPRDWAQALAIWYRDAKFGRVKS